jgi:hypothetical protein
MIEVLYRGRPLRAHYDPPNWVVALSGVTYHAFPYQAAETPEMVSARLVEWAESRPDLFPGE